MSIEEILRKEWDQPFTEDKLSQRKGLLIRSLIEAAPMARTLCIEYEGAFYHGAARGNGQSMIYNWSEKGLNRSGLNGPELRADPVYKMASFPSPHVTE